MALGRIAVLQTALVYAWVMSAQLVISETQETSPASLEPSPTVAHTTDSSYQISTDTIHPRTTEQTVIDSTLADSTTIASKTVTASNLSTESPVEKTALQSSTDLTGTVQLANSTAFSTTHSSLPLNQTIDSVQVSDGNHTFLPGTAIFESATTYYIESTDSKNNEITASIITLSDAVMWSTPLESHLTLTESFSSLLLSISRTEGSFSEEMSQSIMSVLSDEIQPTSAVSILSSSVPMTTWLATTTMSTASTPQTSSHSTTSAENVKNDSAGAMSTGAKVAVGVIVSVCILGVVVAGVIVYQRYNFTHRSFKSFLSSGVRYKTYNNATYKDDEAFSTSTRLESIRKSNTTSRAFREFKKNYSPQHEEQLIKALKHK